MYQESKSLLDDPQVDTELAPDLIIFNAMVRWGGRLGRAAGLALSATEGVQSRRSLAQASVTPA